MARKISRDATDVLFDYGFHPTSRYIYLGSVGEDSDGDETGVNYQMAERLHKQLHVLETSSTTEPIFIDLVTPGGDNDYGFAIYDRICRSPCHITIQGVGQVMSAGTVILQAADRRLLSANTLLMFHYGHMKGQGNPGEVLPMVSSWQNQLRKYERLFLEKMLTKNPKTRLKDVIRLLQQDTYMSAHRAVELGLADEVV